MEGWRRASSSLDFAYRSFKSVLQLIVCDPPFRRSTYRRGKGETCKNQEENEEKGMCVIKDK